MRLDFLIFIFISFRHAFSQATYDVIFAIDVATSNETHFAIQQNRALRILKYLDSSITSTNFRTAIIEFDSTPREILEFGSPFSNDTGKVTSILASLKPKKTRMASVARVLKSCLEQFETSKNSRKILFLAHDGNSDDSIAETLPTTEQLEAQKIQLFVLTGNQNANVDVLLGYVRERERIYQNAADVQPFRRILSAALFANDRRAEAFAAPLKPLKSSKFEPQQSCVFEKVDLMIVLDTSGSVYRIFEEQRQFTIDFINKLPKSAFNDGRIQASIVKFSANPIIHLQMGLIAKSDLINKVREVIFTGGITRIATAVNSAIDTVNKAKRSDARQIFILISDGHGQESWSGVQKTGSRLREQKFELFAVSASYDYSSAELLIYVGDKSRLYVGVKTPDFIPDLSKYVRDCVGDDDIENEQVLTTTSTRLILNNAAKEDDDSSSDRDDEETLSNLQEVLKPASPAIPASDAPPTTPIALDVPITRARPVDMISTQSTLDGIFVEPIELTTATTSTTVQESSSATLMSTSELPVGTIAPREEAIANEMKTPLDGDQEGSGGSGESSGEILEGLDIVLNGEGSGVIDITNSRPSKVEPADSHFENIRNDLISNSKCPIDLILMIDNSQSVENVFMAEIQSAIAVVDEFTEESYINGMVRVGIVTFASNGTLIRNLIDSTKSNILNAIRSIPHIGGSTSSISGAKIVVENILPVRRANSKMLIALFSDGHSQDAWSSVLKWSSRLHEIPHASTFALTPTSDYSEPELKIWAGSEERVFIDPKRLLVAIAKMARSCQLEDAVSSGDVKTIIRDDLPKAQGIKIASNLNEKSRGSCLADLVLIIDTSSSIEEVFDKEIEIAKNLVQNLSDARFATGEIRIGAIVFHSKAKAIMNLNDNLSKIEVINTLEALKLAGGNTSVASGVHSAINHIGKNRRINSKLLVVLISDGNSQDHWKEVTHTSMILHSLNPIVFAVTASKKYGLRELEVYVGDPTRIFTDERASSLVDAVTHSMNENCEGDEKTKREFSLDSQLSLCDDDLVDLVVAVDNSKPIDNEFLSDQLYFVDLIKQIPEFMFKNRLRVSLIPCASVLRSTRNITNKSHLLTEIDRLDSKQANGISISTCLVEASEILYKRPPGSRGFLVFFGSGNDRDTFEQLDRTTPLLKNYEVFAVSTAKTLNRKSLTSIAGKTHNVYINDRLDRFSQDVGSALVACRGKAEEPKGNLPDSLPPIAANSLKPSESCKKTKLDLQIILDASSSREDVFERQRKIVAELVERLPIDLYDNFVAVGISSFTSTPIIRQNLGLGRTKQEIRDVLNTIDYRGGSTRTAKAIHLSIDDLDNSKRRDALQAIVLINDGISQDDWQEVLNASARLRSVQSQRYGLAFGDEIDLRELSMYVEDPSRIYRDNDTKRFLDDIVSLVYGGVKECARPKKAARAETDCYVDTDFIIIFDNSDMTEHMIDPSVNANRYLLLDILGSLSKTFNNTSSDIRFAVFSTSPDPILNLDFTSIREKNTIAEKIESIRSVGRQPSYLQTLLEAVRHFRDDNEGNPRKKAIILVGDGETDSKDRFLERNLKKLLREKSDVKLFSVDASTHTNINFYSRIIGNRDDVFEYERNGVVVQRLLKFVEKSSCGVKETKKARKKVNLDELQKRSIEAQPNVEETFKKEREMAREVIERLRVGENNARVAIIKFASEEKVKTVWSFKKRQSKQAILNALEYLPFSSGTTAIHAALQKAALEYTEHRGARPGIARPIALLFTDGFGKKSSDEEAAILRQLIPDIFAVAVNHLYPVSRKELERIVGNRDRVFTDSTVQNLHETLRPYLSDC
ncbi:unnamed protein product [Caenorhabditis bovis]|uniref:VWFA domain-containing protein n=1 Tax=Caenorhabditis bovis TaxID=2654633 RepID=A0A8S1F323_9PELO|nr:unnamed protein product [Caenorhabditis bovis]